MMKHLSAFILVIITVLATVALAHNFPRAFHHIKKQHRAMRNSKTSTGFELAEVPELDRKIRNAVRAVPKSFDWRAKGCVSPVQNEGQCGTGTVTMTMAANIEGVACAKAAANGQPHKLCPVSAGQMTDCFSQDQCDGAMPSDIISEMKNQTCGLVATAASYPYTSGNGEPGTCRTTGWTVAEKVDKFVWLPPNEDMMAAALVSTGPIFVVVDPAMLIQYATVPGHIISGKDCTSFQMYEHCLALVGFQEANGTAPAYWIAKNTWSDKYGTDGYFFLEKGVNCSGIAGVGNKWDQPSTVTVF